MSENENPQSAPTPKTSSRRTVPKTFIITVLVLTLISMSYRILLDTHYSKSSALYVGIPALLAIGLSFIPTPRSVTGSILFWITLIMLTIGVLAIEGLICILISLPFFLAIGFIVGIFIDKARARKDVAKTRFSLILVLGCLSLEGTHSNLSLNRNETITIKRTTSLSETELQQQLASGPRFDTDALPLFLRAGFPRPLDSLGGGDLELGTQWTIPFDHGEKSPHNLTVKISERTPNSLTLLPVLDETEMGKWMTWEKITWHWRTTPQGQTEVSLTLDFQRNLDPALYFGPVQRLGVKQAGRYFLDSIIEQ